MRENDFFWEIKVQALKKANNHCGRCWSEKDSECHHIIPHELGGQSTLNNCVVLWYLEGKCMGAICEMLNSVHVRSKKGGCLGEEMRFYDFEESCLLWLP
jgi:hypothetical protein